MKTENKKNDNTIVTSDNIEVYEDNIYALCDEFIDNLRDPEDIYTNKRLLSDMLRYVYKNHVAGILNNNRKNGNRYNIYVLDKIFDITTNICHKYNSNMHILLFCCITNINRDTVNSWKSNNDRNLTPEESVIIKKWYQICELDLLQGSSVFDIFLLKSNFMYNDNLASLPLEAQNISIKADQLPDLGLHNNAITDNQNN